MKPVPIGAQGEAEEMVEFKHTLTAHHSELPPVYSTPDMIRLMETAAFHALHQYCEDDEITVDSDQAPGSQPGGCEYSGRGGGAIF